MVNHPRRNRVCVLFEPCNTCFVLAHCCFGQGFEKMQKTMGDQQQVKTSLMQERKLLQQQVALLQQQSRSQGDALRRTQLQKQRLEGLCRTLQVNSLGCLAHVHQACMCSCASAQGRMLGLFLTERIGSF